MAKRFSTITEQVAQAIREGLNERRWAKTLPGRNRLAAELGVNHKTVQAALVVLEAEGLIQSQGPGRERLIVERDSSKSKSSSKGLRVMILGYERSDLVAGDLLEVVYRLNLGGHVASTAGKTLVDLGMKVHRVAKYVKATEADAWVVWSAPRDILEWFSESGIPAFALFGRSQNVSIASASLSKIDALKELLDRLHLLGHQRIVMLSRKERILPEPAALERAFQNKLKDLGISPGPYHLPVWDNHPEGLRQALMTLFRHTPPTALIVDDPVFLLGVVHQLAAMGISAPSQVSLACNHYSSTFEWCLPHVTHMTWDLGAAVRRIVTWCTEVSQGKNQPRKLFLPVKLVTGGTTGPAPKKR